MGKYEAGVSEGRVRDRKATKAFLDEEAEKLRRIEDAKQRVIEGKLKEQEELRKTFLKTERLILEGNGLWDDRWKLPQSAVLLIAGMSEETIRKTNREEAQKFMNQTPDYYNIPENGELLLSYLIANDVKVANVEVYERAFKRLTELGMLKQKHVVNLQPARPKEYTNEEIEKMSSEEYARAFNLKKVRPEEALPAPSGYVPVDPAVAPIKRDGREESADAYRARLARLGISTRIPPKAPWGPNA
jgi:hypothetical protein